MSTNRFKEGLRAGASRPMTGTWLMSASPLVAEALGWCGFDFLVVDMEHSPLELSGVVEILRALATTPTEALVRLSWNDPVLVKRLLDAGARNLMFPFVQTAAEARAAARATRYPPDGVRGVAAVHRASRFGLRPDYFAAAGEEICVVVQLETPEAVEALPAIAAEPFVDSLFLGPGDLSAAMGRIGRIGDPEVAAVIRRAAELARAADTPIGIVGPRPEAVRAFLDQGYGWAAVASDLAFLTGRAREWALALAGGEGAPPSPAAGPY